MRRIALITAFSFICLSLFFWQRTNQEIKKQSEIQMENVVENAYKSSYDRGYRAFLLQTNTTEPGAAYQYTSQIQEQPVSQEVKDSAEYKEAMNQGYTDGYHRASELNHCPRNYYAN